MARGPIERLLVPSACPLACTASFIVLDRLTPRFSGSPTQLPIKAAHRRVRCKRLLDCALTGYTIRSISGVGMLKILVASCETTSNSEISFSRA